MTPGELERLKELAQLLSQTDLAKFAEAKAEDVALQQKAAALKQSATPPESAGISIGSVQFGTEEKWEKWRSLQLARIQAERAKMRVKLEAARDKARHSFGREQVLDEILFMAKQKR